MRRLHLLILLATAGLMTISSCAERIAEDTQAMQQESFEAWIKQHVAETGAKLKKQENGMYVEFLKDGDQSLQVYDTLVWMRMNYTATDLYNNVFVTRNEEQALKQATFTPRTYYVPDYAHIGDVNYSMISGQYYALKNELVKPDGTKITMTEGTKLRLYLPGYLAFGANGYTDDQGYGGQYALNGNKPVIDEIEIVEVIKNPIEREEKLVIDYARDKWGMAETDTLATCLYLDTINFRPDLKKPYKEDYALTADTTAKVWFVGKFLDCENYKEFIFDTNIDSVYNRFYNRRSMDGYYADARTLSVLKYNPEEDQNSYISAFHQVIPNIRKGQWCRILFTSAYGYGATGLTAAIQAQADYYNDYSNYIYNSYYSDTNSYYSAYYDTNYYAASYYSNSISSEEEVEDKIITEIQPYTPLIFEIYIETEDEDEDS